jgi:hypothetical protein
MFPTKKANMKLALNLPINTVSFGQVSTLLLRTLHEREKAGNQDLDLYLFPIGGQADLSSQRTDEDFRVWLQSKVNRAFEDYSRDIPIFKLWHLNGSLESFGKNQTLFTFYELDNPTRVEMNIARNNKLCLSSEYSVNVFKLFGINAHYLPLAFDSYNFNVVQKKFNVDNRIVFNLCGKLERRKHHAKVIQTWIKKYGRSTKYFLQCATFNPFLGRNPQECEAQNNELIRQIVNGNKPFNVEFYPMMKDNFVYNDFLNSADIILGMSGGEGWGLPEFQSIALGKHAVLLNAHAYKTWATPEMATFVNTSGKITSVDNIFFKQGDAFNQGQIYDWNPDEFIDGCEKAIANVEKNRVNEVGLTLQTTYTKEKFADNVITLATT